MEEQLAANLESFFQQDYPDYEVIFGARDAENPAVKIAEEVRARYPHVPSRVILSGPPPWPNAKVFSLDKMIAASSRSYFIISDSDVRVAPDFLRNTIPPLLDPKVGLVTCMYRGIPASDFWSCARSARPLGRNVVRRDGRGHDGGDALRPRTCDGRAARCDRRHRRASPPWPTTTPTISN